MSEELFSGTGDHEHNLQKIAEVHLSPSLMFEMRACIWDGAIEEGKLCAAMAFGPILPDKDAENRVGQAMGQMAAGAIRSMMIMEMVSIMGSENLSGVFQILGHGMKQVVDHPEMLLTMGEEIADSELGLTKEQVDLLRKGTQGQQGSDMKQTLMNLSDQMVDKAKAKQESKKKEVDNLDKLWDTAPEDGGTTTT
jgi:hypothetical protein